MEEAATDRAHKSRQADWGRRAHLDRARLRGMGSVAAEFRRLEVQEGARYQGLPGERGQAG